MDDHDDAFTPLPSRKRTGWRPLDFVRRRHARFREEWCLMEASGMFGDFGTLLPLLLAMANVGSVAPAAALFWFGAFNVATAYEWDVPMCVQPMKTIAAAAIADGLSAGAVSAAGLFVGAHDVFQRVDLVPVGRVEHGFHEAGDGHEGNLTV